MVWSRSTPDRHVMNKVIHVANKSTPSGGGNENQNVRGTPRPSTLAMMSTHIRSNFSKPNISPVASNRRTFTLYSGLRSSVAPSTTTQFQSDRRNRLVQASTIKKKGELSPSGPSSVKAWQNSCTTNRARLQIQCKLGIETNAFLGLPTKNKSLIPIVHYILSVRAMMWCRHYTDNRFDLRVGHSTDAGKQNELGTRH